MFRLPRQHSNDRECRPGLKECPWSAKLLLKGDLNVNLAETEGDWREEDIAAALTMAGLEDMSDHFLPQQRPWCWYGRIWILDRAGREVRS